MSAVRTACLVEDNLAGEPRVFPKGQYEAMVSFRVLHTDRVPDPDTGGMEGRQDQRGDGRVPRREGRTPRAADRRTPGRVLPREGGRGLGAVAAPSAYLDQDGRASADIVLAGMRIVPDQLMNERRTAR